MKQVAVSVDQLRRPQPGGIGTYVRGLLRGLDEFSSEWAVHQVGPPPASASAWGEFSSRLRLRYYTDKWASSDYGVPAHVDVIHASTLAGPFGPPTGSKIRSVTMQDLMWRDEPESTTERGRAFHEARFQLVVGRRDIRVLATTDELSLRLQEAGITADRIHRITLGLDHEVAADEAGTLALLGELGIDGPFTLCVGTLEPRKNLERLSRAHAAAVAQGHELGPLVLVGPRGWGLTETGTAITAGLVPRPILAGLYARCTVSAYVPLREGWGLPPLEALHWGSRVVSSTSVPSTRDRSDVVHVDPLDEASIVDGLARALALSNDEPARQARRASVASLTWTTMAEQHTRVWQ